MARFERSALESAAMAQGNQAGDIFYRLGILYSTGVELPADKVAAHKWFNLAAARGNRDAVRLRRELADEMSDLEIAAAQRAAREWLIRH
jgi:TPR repeat protein